MSELTKEEREKEKLNDEIERALQTLVSTDVCPLPIRTPEEIQSRKELCKIILDELKKKLIRGHKLFFLSNRDS